MSYRSTVEDYGVEVFGLGEVNETSSLGGLILIKAFCLVISLAGSDILKTATGAANELETKPRRRP